MADDPKQDEPRGMPGADGELASAYERIKSAGEDLARLDRLVSGLERASDSPPRRQKGAGAARRDVTVGEAPTSENQPRHPGLRQDWLMRGGLVGLLVATGILAAASASRYGNDAKAIMARWTQQASIEPRETPELRGPARSLTVEIADAGGRPSAPAPSSHKEAEDVPSTGATASPNSISADLAPSLGTIAHDLASINEKLEKLKSSNEQALRDQADAIQQLKIAQEQSARDNARIAEQVQALQTQLAALSAKSSAPGLKKENDVAARQHVPAAAPRRPRRPREPWMPPPDMVDPWGYSDW